MGKGSGGILDAKQEQIAADSHNTAARAVCFSNIGILNVFAIGNPLLNEKLEHGYSPFFPIGLFFIIAKAISEVKANFFRGEALQYTQIMV